MIFRLIGLSHRISETVQDMTKVVITRKSNARFRLITKATTLVDPELTLNGHYALLHYTRLSGLPTRPPQNFE